jgi:hypothetical protein
LLVCLVDEEKDIYIGVLVVVCHLEPVQLNPFDYLGVAESIRIYTTATAPPHH